jgi:hypothetical protein
MVSGETPIAPSLLSYYYITRSIVMQEHPLFGQVICVPRMRRYILLFLPVYGNKLMVLLCQTKKTSNIIFLLSDAFRTL